MGPSIKDVSPNFRFLGYPPSPGLLKSASERLLFGHFLYPPPSPFGETPFMDGPYVIGLLSMNNVFLNQSWKIHTFAKKNLPSPLPSENLVLILYSDLKTDIK